MLWMLVTCCMLAVVSTTPVTFDDEPEWEQPAFCSRECPPFETLEEHEGYEVRQYDTTKWVSTSYSANSTEARNQHKQAFWRLFRYIGGQNSQGMKIPMTVPVVTKTSPCSTPGCEASFVRSFYIPSAFQENTPVPTDERVYLENRDPITVFVRSYIGSRPSTQVNMEHIDALQEAVGDQAKPGVYYKLGYGPYRSPNAHNEAWLEKTQN